MNMKKWRSELASLLKNTKSNKGVELGVYRGRSFHSCLKSNPQLVLTGIDAWKSEEGYPQFKLFLYEIVCRLIRLRYCNRAYLIKGDVTECVNRFADKSLDFVHYDLFNFRTSSVAFHEKVLRLWIPKIRENGILVGRNFSEKDIAAAFQNLGLQYYSYKDGNSVSEKLLYTTIHHNRNTNSLDQ